MGIDNTMTYRVRLDDSDFQAKLTQMRASMDSTFGGGGGGGMSQASMMSYMNSFQSPYGGNPGQVSPIAFSPTPTAITPNMGQFSLRQGFMNTMSGALTGSPIAGTPPASVSMYDYMAYSQRSLADSASRGAAIASSSMIQTGIGIGASAVGTVAGAAMFGSTFGGPIGGIVGSIAGMAMASPVGTAVADNQRIQEYLSNTSFRYMTGADRDPLTGRGFNRQDRQNIAGSVMDMERQDFRINMADVENIMTKGTQAGLFEGTRDVDDFKSKFKGLVDKVKRITSTLNTTASEGIEVLKMYKDMGITDTNDVIGMATMSDAMGMVAGRTGMEMTAIGSQGAGIFKGTGVKMKYGFQMNQSNAARAQLAFTNGVINADELSQAGGVEGMAATMTANTLSGLQTGTGRMVAMSMFNASTMSLDAGRMGTNLSATASGAAGNFRGPQDVLKYDLYQRKMINDFGEQFGGMGLQVLDMGLTANLMSAGKMAGLTDTEDQVRYAAKMRGITDEAAIKTMIDQFKNPGGMKAQMTQALNTALSKSQVEDFRDKSMLMHLGEATKDFMARTFTDPLARIATDVGNAAGSMTENALMRLSGGDIIYGGGRDVSNFAMSKAASKGGITRVDTTGMTGGMFGGRFMSGAADRLVEQVEGRLNSETANTAAGQEIEIGNRKVRVFGSEDDANAAAKAMGSAVITKANMGSIRDLSRGNYFVVTDSKADLQASERDKKYSISKQSLDKATSSTTSADRDIAYDIEANTLDSLITKMAMSGALGEGAKNRVGKNTGGNQIDQLTPEELAKARVLSKSTSGSGKNLLLEKTQGGFADISSSAIASASADSQKAKGRFLNTLLRTNDNGSAIDRDLYAEIQSNDETRSAVVDYLAGAPGGKGQLAALLGRERADKLMSTLGSPGAIGDNIKAQAMDLASARKKEIDLATQKFIADGYSQDDAMKKAAMQVNARTEGIANESSGDKSADAIKNFEKMAGILETLVQKIEKNNPQLLK